MNLLPILLTTLLGLVPLLASAETHRGQNNFIGHWALKLANGDAGWLNIEQAPDGDWSAELWRVGQNKKISEIRFVEGQLHFLRHCRIGPPEYPTGPSTGPRVPCHCIATVKGDEISIKLTSPSKKTWSHSGKRLPPLPPRPDLTKIKFGKPINLFNGKNLSGWKLTNPNQRNGWKAVDGVLVNETPKTGFDPFSRFGNLQTTRKFGDGRLTIEFNVPEGGNSGIYVRGAYEAQVVDRDSRMQGVHGIGAIFNRIAPTKNAGKPGGQWQRYDITIVNRHATVILNGEKIIANQPIIGNTNGALTADITQPEAHYLQGDHTSVKYRNIIWHPVLPTK